MADVITDIAAWNAAAAAELLGHQNADGGWPRRSGGSSHTEATSLALLALATSAPQSEDAPSALEWLAARQRSDGFITASASLAGTTWMTPLGGLALAWWGRSDLAGSAAAALLDVPVFTWDGTTLPDTLYSIDARIPGWPWTEGDFSFVEPTSLAMIFLKQNGYRGAVRVRQGADLLHDRAIEAGGWNYGEPAVLGGDLFPTDVPTAVALLALADERDDTAAAGLSWLLSRRGQISSLLSLGWVTIALNVLGVLDDDWRADVVDRWHALPERRGPRETALCLLGLSDTADHPLGVVSL